MRSGGGRPGLPAPTYVRIDGLPLTGPHFFPTLAVVSGRFVFPANDAEPTVVDDASRRRRFDPELPSATPAGQRLCCPDRSARWSVRSSSARPGTSSRGIGRTARSAPLATGHAGSARAGLLTCDSRRDVPAVVRRARTPDVPAIKALVDIYAGSGRKLLAKELVTLYEDVQDFLVAELDGAVVGLRRAACAVGRPRRGPHARGASRPRAAPHRPAVARRADRHRARARAVPAVRADVPHRVLRPGRLRRRSTAPRSTRTPTTRCAAPTTPGVAEFLNLEYVKPNTLGNTRMLLNLE